jgi:hypothetical protein
MPSIPGEVVFSFDIAPTLPSNDVEATAKVMVIPSLILLTKPSQPPTIDNNNSKTLKVVRCPANGLSDWPLEIGMLPEPSNIAQVQLSGSSNDKAGDITAISGFIPSTINTSMASILLKCFNPISRKRVHDREIDAELDDWDIAMSTASPISADAIKSRTQNVLLVGHKDG